MLKRSLTTLICLAALAGVCATGAAAADTVVSPDVNAGRMTALDATTVWVSGSYGNQTLMVLKDGVTAPVTAAAKKTTYPSVDLGHDAAGALVLTYLRCDPHRACKAFRDDLGGHHSVIKGLTTTNCVLSTAPAYWRSRVAYGQDCTIGTGSKKRDDAKHTGLYVKSGSGAPRQLHRPKDAIKFGIDRVSYADLRGTLVAGVVADIYEYAYSQTVGGKDMHSALIAASEGDSDEHVRGMALGSGSTLWALVDATHVGDPNMAVISRIKGDCYEYEQLINTPAEDQLGGYKATGLAVDGTALFLTTPVGVTTHAFTAAKTCAAP